MPNSRRWPIILPILFFCLLAFGIAIIFKIAWLTAIVAVMALAVSAIIMISSIKASRDLTVLSAISQPAKLEDGNPAYRLLAEMDLASSEKTALAIRVSDIFKEKFRLERFAIFFRENDQFFPRIIMGINKGDLTTPSAYKLSEALRTNIQNGAHSRNEADCSFAFKRGDLNFDPSTMAFAFSWGRTRSVYVVANDLQELFSETVKDPEFNRLFWPALDDSLRLNQKLQEKTQESRELAQKLDKARKDMAEYNQELKSKLLDLRAFVDISNDLYSLFDEEQLFARFTQIVCDKLGAGAAEILVPSGDGRYIPRSIKNTEQTPTTMALDTNSELFELISRATRPVLLPLAGTGFRHDEPFLKAALSANFQIASGIKVEGKTACMIMVSQKSDKTQFTNLDIDFLFIICNIASLALDNLTKYITIEKLSYTDSMTGIYNYRYFYKRLNEEVLRAKRYERELSLVILDIDKFKSFNDNYGHQAGDVVLKQLSDLITKTIRSIDVVSRYGGEEFCIIMPDTGAANCGAFIERLRAQIAEFKFESDLFRQGGAISVSVGGAVYPHHAPTPDRLIYCSDMALLKAKSDGRNRAVMYQPEMPIESKSEEGGFNESHQESIH
jgi:diguanylate cyclase (GGDEF)-like protein